MKIYLALILAGVSCLSSLAEQPAITKKEAALLAHAAKIASTNQLAAANFLQQADTAKSSAAINFSCANYLLMTQQLPQAITAYKAAIAKQPNFREAIKNLAIAYLQNNQPQETIALYQQLAAKTTLNAESLILLAQALMMQNHFVAAENAFRQAMLLNTDDLSSKKGLAQCLLQQERHKEARSLTKNILETTPNDTELWLLLANLNIALNEPQKAITALETSRRINGNSPDIMLLLGDLYLNSSQPQYAAECYLSSIALGCRNTEHMLQAAQTLLSINNTKHARSIINAIDRTKLTPQEKIIQLKIEAGLAVADNKPTTAIKIYRQIIAKNPADGEAMLQLGKLLAETGNTIEAELTYERAARIPQQERQALIQHALLSVNNNRIQKAVTLLQKAQQIKSTPDITKYLQQLQHLL